MVQVTFTGWRRGLQKIKLNALLRECGGISLGPAKRVVDLMLDHQVVPVAPLDRESAAAFVESAREMGADSQLGEQVGRRCSGRARELIPGTR